MGSFFRNIVDDDYLQSYHEKLGSYGSIDVKKSRWKVTCFTDTLFFDTQWEVTYTIDGFECFLIVITTRTFDGFKDAKVNTVTFDLKQYSPRGILVGSITFSVHNMGECFLGSKVCDPFITVGNFESCRQKEKTTITESGYVTKTRACLFGNESKGGLIVLEDKRKNGDDKKPCKVTVAHYYTVSSGNIFSKNKIDIGLSVIATIQPSSKLGLDLHINGPAKHPSAALHYMFEEVMETGIWKPTMCPHCARIESQHSDMPSESEDKDRFSSPGGHDRISNKITLIKNETIKGDKSGSLTVHGNLKIMYNNISKFSQGIIQKKILRR